MEFPCAYKVKDPLHRIKYKATINFLRLSRCVCQLSIHQANIDSIAAFRQCLVGECRQNCSCQ